MTSQADVNEIQVRAADPLLCDLPLPLKGTFHPLGFSVEIWTNSREVLAAAQESWGFFPRVFSESPVVLRLAVSDSDATACPSPPVFRGRGHLVSIVADRENFATADLREGAVFGWATSATVRNRPYFRYYFLEGAVLTTLESIYLTSLHAACVAWDKHGVLLCGDAGAGKSSLAFACARQGWTFISDDGASIVRSRADRTVLGNPYQMRFRADAPRLFPELANWKLVRGLDGELAIELPTASLPSISTAFQSPIDFVLFLNRRHSGPCHLIPYSPERARAQMDQTICFGDPDVREQQRASLQRILLAEVLELQYSDLDSAVACLRELVSAGAKPGR